MVFTILAVLIVTTAAQRPSYLQGSTYPQLASRFRTDGDDAAAVPNINNRLGESGGTTEKIPIDARGDTDLINRVKEWPRQNYPYWFLNAEHIERHRNPQLNQVSQVSGSQQNIIPQQDNIQRRPLARPLNVGGRFGGNNFALRSGFASEEFADPAFTRPIRPIQTRPFFAGPI